MATAKPNHKKIMTTVLNSIAKLGRTVSDFTTTKILRKKPTHPTIVNGRLQTSQPKSSNPILRTLSTQLTQESTYTKADFVIGMSLLGSGAALLISTVRRNETRDRYIETESEKLSRKHLTPNEYDILFALQDARGSSHEWMTLKELLEETKVTPRWIHGVMTDLLNKGLVEKRQRKGPSFEYRLLWEQNPKRIEYLRQHAYKKSAKRTLEKTRRAKVGKIWTDPETRGFTEPIAEPTIVSPPKPSKFTPTSIEGLAPIVLSVLQKFGEVEFGKIFELVKVVGIGRSQIVQALSLLMSDGKIKKYTKWGKRFVGIA